MTSDARKRRPHGELKTAVRDFLRQQIDGVASISEIRAGTESALNSPPQSSYRSALQDERYFLRLSRGVFKLVEPTGSDARGAK